jgi:hypothetical protein
VAARPASTCTCRPVDLSPKRPLVCRAVPGPMVNGRSRDARSGEGAGRSIARGRRGLQNGFLTFSKAGAVEEAGRRRSLGSICSSCRHGRLHGAAHRNMPGHSRRATTTPPPPPGNMDRGDSSSHRTESRIARPQRPRERAHLRPPTRVRGCWAAGLRASWPPGPPLTDTAHSRGCDSGAAPIHMHPPQLPIPRLGRRSRRLLEPCSASWAPALPARWSNPAASPQRHESLRWPPRVVTARRRGCVNTRVAAQGGTAAAEQHAEAFNKTRAVIEWEGVDSVSGANQLAEHRCRAPGALSVAARRTRTAAERPESKRATRLRRELHVLQRGNGHGPYLWWH